MSLGTSIAKLCIAVGKSMDSAAPAEIKSSISTASWLGGILMAIPLWGIESIIYAIVLWNMYSKVAKIAGIDFKTALITNIIGGFIINVVVVFILNIILEFIPVVGWIVNFVIGFGATRYSGIAYLGILETFHGKQAMKVRLDREKGTKAFKEAGGDKAALKTAAGGAIELLD